jgi:hypothetical protein
MADDRTKRGPADRLRINVNEPYEVKYWTQELNVSADRLKELVARHGVMHPTSEKALSR